MKKSISLILAILMILSTVSITAGAATIISSGTCGDNLTWKLDSEGTLTVSGTGAMNNYDMIYDTSWFDDHTKINKVVLENGVTTIGDSAFESLNITAVELPETLTSIGELAFYNCFYLTTVELPASLTVIGERAFDKCDNLSSINVDEDSLSFMSEDGILFNKEKTKLIYCPEGKKLTSYRVPDGVTTIGNYAFRNSSILKTIELPDSLKTIEYYAFHNCHLLDEINLPDGLTTIGESAFYDCTSLSNITIPDSVTEIGDGAFCRCYNLTEIDLSDSITEINAHTFDCCYTLTEITLHEGITSIGDFAFSNCISLPGIELPESLTEIGEYTFNSCTAFTTVFIPENVESIGKCAFWVCDSLVDVNVDENNRHYMSEDGILFNKSKSTLVFYPLGKTAASYTVPESVTEIGNYAFADQTHLSEIILPEGLTTLGEFSIYYCPAITEIDLPESLTKINEGAFANCEALTTITIPENITVIEASVFSGCSSLEEAYLPSGINTIEARAFSSCSSLRDVYFNGTKAQWKEIYIGSINDELFNAVIHFTDGTSEDPEDPAENCSHICHNSGFFSIFWKIINFFSKLFNINPVCECGAAHY